MRLLQTSCRFVWLAAAGTARLLLMLLLIGLVATVLVRLAPGFGTDERELDSRLSNASIDLLTKQEPQGSIASSYLQFLRNASRGDLGISRSFDMPVSQLFSERYSTSLRVAVPGWTAGWAAALLFAAAPWIFPSRALRATASLASGATLSAPSALLALAIAIAAAPAFTGVALIVFSRVFRVLDNLFQAAQQMTHVTAARSSGIPEWRIFARHILSSTSPELVALAGTSITIAVGATIPIETFCDQPGIGQLAWKAALARDFSLLVSITLLIAGITLFFNRTADFAVTRLRRGAA